MNTKDEIKEMENKPGYYKHNDFHYIETKEKDIVELKANITENALNGYGTIHGGIIFGLGDNAMGLLAYKLGKPAVTLSSNISYLRPGKGKYIKARAEMIKSGTNTCFLRCNIYDDNEVLIATMDGNYFNINNK